MSVRTYAAKKLNSADLANMAKNKAEQLRALVSFRENDLRKQRQNEKTQ
jgi:hypothetical protein